MQLQIKYFKEYSLSEWDSLVTRFQKATFDHSWTWLTFISKQPNILNNVTFVCMENDKTPLAIVPLAVTKTAGNNIELSFNGFPCPIPVFAKIKPRTKRKLFDSVFYKINEIAKENNAKKILFKNAPVSLGTLANETLYNADDFELLRYQFNYLVHNTFVMDLRIKEEELFSNVSQYQRKTIKKAEKKGISFQAIDQSQDIQLIKTHFDSFQNAHFISAGRMTRPQETWDCMFDAIVNGKATLFLAVKDDTIFSYLFCGEFEKIAIGWSQVNIEEYEKEFSPRHFLEWNSIIYYQKKGFNFYIVGERYFGDQLFHHPTEKEQSIGQFKERYGGTMLPVVVWTGYLDKQLMQNEMSQMMNCFLENSNGCAFPNSF